MAPLFYIMIIQFFNYIAMIYHGVNQKSRSSIGKFNKKSTKKFETIEGFEDGLRNLVIFFFWRSIPTSELRREMTIDAQLEYECEPDSEEEKGIGLSMDSFKSKAYQNYDE